MDEYGFEVIPRLTIGRVPDCINGCELSFTGVAEWTQTGAVTNPSGGIETFLNPVPPFDATDITAYVNSIAQSQRLEAQYWSVEANRTLVGYEKVKIERNAGEKERVFAVKREPEYLCQHCKVEGGPFAILRRPGRPLQPCIPP